MYLVGFIIRIYHDARSPGRLVTQYVPFTLSLDATSLLLGKLASLSTPKMNAIAHNTETGKQELESFFIFDYFDHKLGVSFRMPALGMAYVALD